MSHTSPTPGPEPPRLSNLAARAHARARRRRWTKRTIVWGSTLLVAGILGAYVIRGTLTRRVALATLERTFGYHASCGSAEMVTHDRVRLPDVVLRARGIEGEAAEVLTADGVELVVDWARALFDPAGAVSSVLLINPTVRVSLDIEENTLNIGGVGAARSRGIPRALPPVTVDSASVIFGEHGDGWFAPLNRISVTGVLTPRPGVPGVYSLAMRELTSTRTPAILAGDLDLRAGSGALQLEGVDFSALHDRDVTPPEQTLLRRLRVDGRLPVATLEYEGDGTFEARLTLDRVNVRLPAPMLNPEAAGDNTDRPLSMSGVSGDITIDELGLHADLSGMFEDVDARLNVQTAGYDPDAAIDGTIVISEYRLGPNPAFLPYAPPVASELIDTMSGPEATISGRVKLTREGGSASVSGLFIWSDGNAVFEDFPYPIEDISGRLTFDDERVVISALRGAGPTGADITASVTVTPPGNDADIDVTVHAAQVPLDHHLIDAIGSDEADDLYALLRPDALSPGTTAALALADPGFALGGELTLDMAIHKHGGVRGSWDWTVDAASPALSFISDELKYPFTARDFHVRVTETEADATLGAITGPTGLAGSGSVKLTFDDETPAEIGFDLTRVPIDLFLLEGLLNIAPDVSETLAELRARGDIAAAGRLSAADDGLRDEDLTVTLLGNTVGADGSLQDVRGSVRVTPGLVRAQAVSARAGAAELHGSARIDTAQGEWSARVRGDDVSLTRELTTIVRELSAAAGAGLDEFSEKWSPAGAVDAELTLEGAPGRETAWALGLSDFDTLSAEVQGERLELRESSGRVRHDSRSGLLIFDDFSASAVDPATGDSASVVASGSYRTSGEEAAHLHVIATDLDMASPLVRRAVGLSGDPSLVETVEQADPAGRVDVRAEITAVHGAEADVHVVLEPRSLELTRDGTRVRFARTEGAVVFRGGSADVEGLTLTADEWAVEAAGRWGGGEPYTGDVVLRASAVTPGLLAALPEEARDVLTTLELTLGEQGFVRVVVSAGEGDEPSAVEVQFEDAAFTLGAPVDRAVGSLHLTRAQGTGVIDGTLTLDAFRVFKVPMLDGSADLEWDDTTRELRLPAFTAHCEGGIVSGRARMAPVQRSGGSASEYYLDARCADVPLAWILGHATEDAASVRADRGLIAGRLTLRDVLDGGAEPRTGRGEFTVTRGAVLRFPLLTPALELVNLQPPMGEELDDAAIEFGIVGNTIVFDRLFVQSRSILVEASGRTDLSSGALDLSVRSSGRRRVPFVSDLIDTLRDELVATRITGTLADPEYAIVQLPNAGRILLGAIAPGAGGSADPQGPPARPPMAEHVFSVLEPIDE